MRISFLSKNIGIRLLIVAILDLVLFIPVILGISSELFFRYPLVYFAVLVVFSIVAFYLLREVDRRYLKGFSAEVDIGLILKKLPAGYHRLYDLKLGNHGNIDYAVVGPTGIWTLEVKSTKGTITTDGTNVFINRYRREDINLSQPYAQAKSLESIILEQMGKSYSVIPMLVFANKFVRIRLGERPVRGVYVVGSAWVTKIITTKGSIVLSESEVQSIYNCLCKYTSVF